MKTKKLKNFIKKNYSKELVLNAYEFYADPPSYFEELVRVIYFYTNNYNENELKRMSYEQLADIYITELLFKREGWTENKKIN